MDATCISSQALKISLSGWGLGEVDEAGHVEPNAPAGSLNVRGSSEILGIIPSLASGVNTIINVC